MMANHHLILSLPKNINGDVSVQACGPTAALRVILYCLTNCIKIGKYPWAVGLQGEVNSWCVNKYSLQNNFEKFFKILELCQNNKSSGTSIKINSLCQGISNKSLEK